MASTSGIDQNKIVHHISVVSDEMSSSPFILQLVILDRYEYDELSSRIMRMFQENPKFFESKFNIIIDLSISFLLLFS